MANSEFGSWMDGIAEGTQTEVADFIKDYDPDSGKVDESLEKYDRQIRQIFENRRKMLAHKKRREREERQQWRKELDQSRRGRFDLDLKETKIGPFDLTYFNPINWLRAVEFPFKPQAKRFLDGLISWDGWRPDFGNLESWVNRQFSSALEAMKDGVDTAMKWVGEKSAWSWEYTIYPRLKYIWLNYKKKSAIASYERKEALKKDIKENWEYYAGALAALGLPSLLVYLMK